MPILTDAAHQVHGAEASNPSIPVSRRDFVAVCALTLTGLSMPGLAHAVDPQSSSTDPRPAEETASSPFPQSDRSQRTDDPARPEIDNRPARKTAGGMVLGGVLSTLLGAGGATPWVLSGGYPHGQNYFGLLITGGTATLAVSGIIASFDILGFAGGLGVGAVIATGYALGFAGICLFKGLAESTSAPNSTCEISRTEKPL